MQIKGFKQIQWQFLMGNHALISKIAAARCTYLSVALLLSSVQHLCPMLVLVQCCSHAIQCQHLCVGHPLAARLPQRGYETNTLTSLKPGFDYGNCVLQWTIVSWQVRCLMTCGSGAESCRDLLLLCWPRMWDPQGQTVLLISVIEEEPRPQGRRACRPRGGWCAVGWEGCKPWLPL